MLNPYPPIAMPAHKYITDEALALLTEIGFPADKLSRGEHNIPHNHHPSLVVSFDGRAVLDPDAFTFRLSSSASRAYSDLKIPSRLVSQAKPFWKKTVMRWYTKAVFSLGEMRRRREESETNKRIERERILSQMALHIPPDLGVTPEQVFEVMPMRIDEEDDLDTLNYSHHIRVDVEQEPNPTRIAQMARLVAFLRRENIKYS